MTARAAWLPVDQQGQALVLGMLIVAVGAVSLVVLYNLGQTTETRARLTHAADAAAFSGALEQARTLNTIAYLNRTQIAHQVAMAHLVTLGASASYGQALQRQHQRRNPPASLIAMLFGPDVAAAYGAVHMLPGVQDRLARAFAQHDRVVHQVLEAEAAFAVSALPASRDRIMRRVLQANFSDKAWASGNESGGASSPALRLLSDGWLGYLAGTDAKRLAMWRPVLKQATDRYGFLKQRDRTRRNPWPVSARCPLLRHELRRRGSTWLGPDGRWGALDTQSLHSLRSNRWVGCYFREYAMGWGSAQGQKSRAPDGLEYVDDPPLDFSEQDFWRWVEQSTSWNIFSGSTNPLASSYGMAATHRWPGRGLPRYRDVALARSPEPLRFAVAVRLAGSRLATTDAASQVSSPIGRFRYAALGRAGAVTVSSAAETYFVRPQPRADGRKELATLFRPYWQARLSAVTPIEALQARSAP